MGKIVPTYPARSMPTIAPRSLTRTHTRTYSVHLLPTLCSGGLLLQGAGVLRSSVTLQACELENRVTLVPGLIVGNIPNISP